ncbi:immunity 49 family protein [Nocardia sp. NPDC004722]
MIAKVIHRPGFDVYLAQVRVSNYGELIDASLADVGEYPHALGSARWRTLNRLQYQLIVDPPAADVETWSAAVLASEVANAVFAASSESDGTVRYVIGRPCDLPALGPNRLSSPGDWVAAAWLAVITRNKRRIEELCEVGKYTLRASGVRTEGYMFPWIEVIQRFLGHEEVSPELFDSVMRLTDPGVVEFTPEDFVLKVAYPPVEMFYSLLRRDADRFNDSLARALGAYRSYWSSPELSENPNGFVALGPLAIATLACDVGIPIEIESDYLPTNLVNGTWVNGGSGRVRQCDGSGR